MSQTVSGNKHPILKFDQDTVDFGIILEGDSFEHDYWFTNTGGSDLIIKQAYPACGCTYPTYNKEPIKAGERGFIHVVFHSKGFAGDTVLKTVIVINNSQNERYAVFSAIILDQSRKGELEKLRKEREKALNKKKGRKRRK